MRGMGRWYVGFGWLTAGALERQRLAWRPPGSDLDRTSADEVNVVAYNPHGSLSLSQQREQLPIFQLRAPKAPPNVSALR